MIWLLIILAIIILAYIDFIPRFRNGVLISLCIIFTVIVGMRTNDWNDTSFYWRAFVQHVQPIWDIEFTSKQHYLNDRGFLVINSLIKTFTSDRFVFFTSVAAITNLFLYKDLKTYTTFPIAGLLIYIGRFGLARNFMQIRAALAILIVIYAIKYLSNNDWKKYFFWIVIASTIHFSMVFAIPMYWINKLKLTSKRIIVLTLIAIVITIFLSHYIKDFATLVSFKYDIATAYTNENSEYTHGKSLANPMIYFQIFILWSYSLCEKKLIQSTPYYYVIRNGYFYSTILLILLSTFGTLSGRTSTIFATLEIFIIPNMCKIFKPKYQYVANLFVCLLALIFFYTFFSLFMTTHPSFKNPLILR